MATEDLTQLDSPIATPHVCDGGNLDCGSGLLLVIRKAMDQVPSGDVLRNSLDGNFRLQ